MPSGEAVRAASQRRARYRLDRREPQVVLTVGVLAVAGAGCVVAAVGGVPSGSLLPGDVPRPRAWLERTANAVRVTEPPRGGHFAPFEEPELYAQELRDSFGPHRAAAAR